MFRISVHVIVLLALSVLIGSVMFFGAGVAGVVFQPELLPSRTLAGAVNAAVLHRLNMFAGGCSAMLVVTLGYLAYSSPRGTSRIAFWLSIPLLGVLLYAALVLFPEVNGLRLEIGDFDNVLASKVAAQERFGELHVVYSRLIQGALFTSVLLLILHVTYLLRRFDPGLRKRVAAAKGEKKKSGASPAEELKAPEAGGDAKAAGNGKDGDGEQAARDDAKAAQV